MRRGEDNLAETMQMLPVTKSKLETAVEELKSIIDSLPEEVTEVEFEQLKETEDYKNALKELEAANSLLQSI